MSTFMATAEHAKAGRWHVIDADGQVLGRIATRAARLLQGKHKPTYTPSIDVGDFVVVVNAAKVKLSGRKEDQKIYRQHSGYEGGLREERARLASGRHREVDDVVDEHRDEEEREPHAQVRAMDAEARLRHQERRQGLRERVETERARSVEVLEQPDRESGERPGDGSAHPRDVHHEGDEEIGPDPRDLDAVEERRLEDQDDEEDEEVADAPHGRATVARSDGGRSPAGATVPERGAPATGTEALSPAAGDAGTLSFTAGVRKRSAGVDPRRDDGR